MRNVLIVDDDKNNRLAIKLNIHKYQDLNILEAENGQQAVDIALKTRLDLVFMDIMMPVMNGIDATKMIKKYAPSVMIVAISAMGDDEHKSFMLQAGAEDYITKPFHPDVLKQRLANYLRLIVNRSAIQIEASEHNNLFDENVYDKRINFRIARETSLALFWEEYLFCEKYDACCLLSDAVRAIYDVSLELLKMGSPFYINCEENDDNLFFTIEFSQDIDCPDIHHIISREFPKGIYILNHKTLSLKISRTATPFVNVHETPSEVKHNDESNSESYAQIIKKTHKYKISAQEYIGSLEDEFSDKCDDFEKEYDKIDRMLFEMQRTENFLLINNLGQEILSFSEIVEGMFEFHDLAESIFAMGTLLKDFDVATLRNTKVLMTLLSSFLSDLESWVKEIFVNKTAADIHYLDSSLCASFVQIRAALMNNGESTDHGEEELELF